ncbi:MAG: plastocyanin/azurin family copper-binding protein [Opitutales bacterium]
MNYKNVFALLSLFVAVFLFTGCPASEEEQPPPPDVPDASPPPDAPPSDENDVALPDDAAVEENGIVITGNDMMRFDPTHFQVTAGQEVTIVFRNIGELPVEAMGHNLVILDLGTDPMGFSMAGAPHPDNNYISPELEDQVIAMTEILGPGEEEELTFTAPAEPGDYDFVCSFPGHAPAGMVGVMEVVE